MIDLYELLGIDADSPVPAVRSAIEVARMTLEEDQEANADPTDIRRRRWALDLAERVLLDETQRQDYDRATRLAETLGRTEKASAKVLTDKAWNLVSKENSLAEAIVLAERAAEVEPINSRAWSLLAHANHEWGYPPDALRASRRAVHLDPADSAAHGVLGEAWKTHERYDDAIAAFERCFELEPNDREAFGPSYWTCLLGTRQFEKAIAFLEELQRSKPDDPDIKKALAFAYSESACADWVNVEEGNVC